MTVSDLQLVGRGPPPQLLHLSLQVLGGTQKPPRRYLVTWSVPAPGPWDSLGRSRPCPGPGLPPAYGKGDCIQSVINPLLARLSFQTKPRGPCILSKLLPASGPEPPVCCSSARCLGRSDRRDGRGYFVVASPLFWELLAGLPACVEEGGLLRDFPCEWVLSVIGIASLLEYCSSVTVGTATAPHLPSRGPVYRF